MSTEPNQTWIGYIATAIAALFGSSGLWAWLAASASTRSRDKALAVDQYRKFVEDLQTERRDRVNDIKRLEAIIDRQDEEIHAMRVNASQWEIHVTRLEEEIRRLGGQVPPRPQLMPLPARDLKGAKNAEG